MTRSNCDIVIIEDRLDRDILKIPVEILALTALLPLTSHLINDLTEKTIPAATVQKFNVTDCYMHGTTDTIPLCNLLNLSQAGKFRGTVFVARK